MLSFDDVAIIIPWRGGDPWRTRLLDWVTDRYAAIAPGATVVLGGQSSRTAAFRRAQCINNGVRATGRPVLLIADGDVTTTTEALLSGLTLLANGAAWVLPYRWYHRLDQDATEALVAAPATVRPPADPEAHKGSRSSLALITRAAFEQTGGFDERFVGWAPEDQAWADAATVLCGRPSRVRGHCWHLWHPAPMADTWHQPQFAAGKALFERYHAARRDPVAMAALVAERKGTR